MHKKILILLAVLIIVPCLYLISVGLEIGSPSSPQTAPISKNILQVNGLSSSTYNDTGDISQKVSAQQITIRPKNVGLFKLRNINEIVIDKLCIEQFMQPGTKSNSGVFAAVEGCLPLSSSGSSSQFGRIVSGTINQFQFKSWTAKKKILLDCQADSGTIDPKKRHLVLKNIVLYNPEHDRTITAAKGVWNPTKKRFEIEGEYVARSPRGKARGKGIAIDLYYQLEKM